ncbi:MAG: F0F1 ATP synthase subunit B [Spirochaetia bacterium]|nr:F0F1 ATP synthase subunit B [Spirochaetia bacterium]
MPLLAEGSFNLLNVDPGLVFWTFVTFTFVLIVLWKYAWTPIITALDARNDKVEGDLKKSEDLRKAAEDLLKSYSDKIDSAKHEVSEILDTARKDAEAMRNKILQTAQEEAGNVKNRAKNEIEQAKVKAVKEIQELSVDISLKLLSSILNKDVNDEEHSKIVHRELEKLKSSNN